MQIGFFRRVDDGCRGRLQSISLDVPLRLTPAQPGNGNAPDWRSVSMTMARDRRSGQAGRISAMMARASSLCRSTARPSIARCAPISWPCVAKRQHASNRVVGDLLKAEIDEKQARSIKYQMTIAKLPLAKEIAGFDFTATPINEVLVRDLATGAFLASQRNAVLVGGTGTRRAGRRWCRSRRRSAAFRRRCMNG